MFNTGDVLVNPTHRTAMYRVLESKGDQVRIVRSGKTGAIHGMVKDKSGFWKNVGELSEFQPLAHKASSRKTTKSTPDIRDILKALEASYTASAGAIKSARKALHA